MSVVLFMTAVVNAIDALGSFTDIIIISYHSHYYSHLSRSIVIAHHPHVTRQSI